MEPPRIQYAKTSDGVSIAFWTLGEGSPLVYMPPFPFSHVQPEWEDPARRAFFERLADQVTLVRYDSRGTGMSETPLRTGPSPLLGEHTDDVLREAGYEPEDAVILRERGIS